MFKYWNKHPIENTIGVFFILLVWYYAYTMENILIDIWVNNSRKTIGRVISAIDAKNGLDIEYYIDGKRYKVRGGVPFFKKLDYYYMDDKFLVVHDCTGVHRSTVVFHYQYGVDFDSSDIDKIKLTEKDFDFYSTFIGR